MSLSVGIVGLPNSGKSTLFNALLSRQIAQVAEYPFTTIEPNTGIVEVPDERLAKLAELLKPEKVVPAAVKFIDIAGLVKGAHKGEGLGNKFLGHIREVDAIVHIVRGFTNPNVSHVHGKIDPQEDIKIVNLELEMAEIKKPTIYVINISENQMTRELDNQIKTIPIIQSSNYPVIQVCAKLEMDLVELKPEERRQYLTELGIKETGLDKVIQAAYKLLDLLTFFTIKGGKQTQAWSLKSGQTALDAAGVVHTDFAKNFIKAEVISFEELEKVGSWSKAQEKGLIRLEGRDYKVCDGDVIEFKTGV